MRSHGPGPGSFGILSLILATAASVCCRSEMSQPAGSLPAKDAPGAALELFRAAREGRQAKDLGMLLEGELSGARRAALASLLAELRETSSARVLAADPAGDETAVDLEATLRGGGKARYHVQARASAAGWRIVSVVGPDASWPPVPAAGGDGLSTSAPPRGDP